MRGAQRQEREMWLLSCKSVRKRIIGRRTYAIPDSVLILLLVLLRRRTTGTITVGFGTHFYEGINMWSCLRRDMGYVASEQGFAKREVYLKELWLEGCLIHTVMEGGTERRHGLAFYP